MKIISYLIEAHIIRQTKNNLEFLLMKRAEHEKYPGIWQMVTGEIMPNEKAYQTAIREINEETGLSPEKFWIVPNINSFYSPEQDLICLLPVFAALVNHNIPVKISDEHVEYKWVNKIEAQKLLAWPGQRESVEIIYNYFVNEQVNLKFVEIDMK